ncbi:hypothetical protein VTJ04DRAFT_1793 [Mycothermus thermophilus]|uniref:uncharacterized protein n=1 Tax=Humicola insolens TaxID=85995 RepID=UPI0037437A34
MSLMNLPDELLDKIAKHFTQCLVDPVVGDNDPPPEKLANSEEDDYARELRPHLLSLTLTNRRLNLITTCLLYQTIRIRDLPTLFLVTRTLFEAPHLATHVQEVSIFVDLGWPAKDFDQQNKDALEGLLGALRDNNQVYNTFSRIAEPFPVLRRIVDEVVEMNIDDMASFNNHNGTYRDNRRYLKDITQVTCILLLLLTSNAVNLQLGLPRSFSDDSLYRAFVTSLMQDVALPRLKQLSLIPNYPYFTFSMMWPSNLPQNLMLGRAIKHIDIFGASFLDHETLVRDAWAHVETLRLEASHFSGVWLHELCKDGGAPRLKDISLVFSSTSGNETKVKDLRGPGMNEALSFLTHTLQKLRLRLKPSIPNDEPHLGAQGRLACLSSMEVLTDLDIDARSLFNSLDDMYKSNICDRLPRSLRRLTLFEPLMPPENNDRALAFDNDPYWNWMEPDTTPAIGPDGGSYQEYLERAFLQLVYESADRLPHLASVTIIRRDTWNINPELGRCLRSVSVHPDLSTFRLWTFTPQRP